MTSIIDQAIQLETKAETNYRQAAEATSDAGAQKLLALLADQEAQHADLLRTMDDDATLPGTDLLAQAKAWVRGSVEGGFPSISADAGMMDVLRRAMSIEQMTEAFYAERAEDSSDPKAAGLFAMLAKIEKEHYLLVSSLVDYYDRPNEWIESAEFGLREDY